MEKYGLRTKCGRHACLEFSVDELADELLKSGDGEVFGIWLKLGEVLAKHHGAQRGELILPDPEEIEDALVVLIVCVDVQTDHLHSKARKNLFGKSRLLLEMIFSLCLRVKYEVLYMVSKL